VAPRVAPVSQDEEVRRRLRQNLDAVCLVEHARQAAALPVDRHTQELVLHLATHGANRGESLRLGRPAVVDRMAQRAHLREEDDSQHAARGGPLYPVDLHRYLAPVRPPDRHQVEPVVPRDLDLDGHLVGPAQRVEDDERQALASGVRAGGQGRQRGLQRVLGQPLGLVVHLVGVLIDLRDARPCQDVVELVEQHRRPGLGDLGIGVVRPAGGPRQRGHRLRRRQELLALSVPALHLGVHRVAPGCVVLEIVAQHR